MQNYTSKNRLSQKFGLKDYSEDRTSLEVVGRVGVNTNEAVQNLDVRGTAYISEDVGIGQTNVDDVVTELNTSKLAVGIVSAFELYGDGSNLINITNVAFADSLDKNSQGQLLYQQGNQITSLLEYGQTGQVLSSQGDNQKPVWTNAAPAGAVEGFLIRDEGVEVGGGTTFGGLNFVGAAVAVEGTLVGGFATVTVNQEFAKVAGFASESRTAGIGSTALELRLLEENSDETNFITFSNNIDGNNQIKTNQNLLFNAVSGVLSATSFVGNGASLTDLNASELSTGTIPDGVFPAILPAISGENLTNLPTPIVVGFAKTAGIATEAITAGIATTAINVTLESEASDTEVFLTFGNNATGEEKLKTNDQLKFNTTDGTLEAPFFSGNGSLLTNLNIGTISFALKSGVSTEADGLTTTRTLWGQNFDGRDNVSGDLIDVGDITGGTSDLTIQPKNDQNFSYDLILKGNNNTSSSGGGVEIGDDSRGAITFKTGIDDGYRFYKEGDGAIFGSFNLSQLQSNQIFTFQNKSGTIAYLDDILEGRTKTADNLFVTSETDDVDYQLTFIDFNSTGIFTSFKSNNQIKYNPSKNQLTLANSGDFVGVGSQLTTLDASKITLGTLNTNRLPNVYRLNDDITIDANGSEGNLRLDAGKNMLLTSGIDNDGTLGGQIILEGKRGEFSYKFKNPTDTNKVASLDCTQVLTGSNDEDVFFTLPGNKTGLGNTFAMLDDITNGTAGTAEVAERVEVLQRNNNDIDYNVLFCQGAGESQNLFISGSNFTYNAFTDKLTAPKFAGIGSDLTQLNASQLTFGTVNTARLPNQYRLNANITIDANGSGNDLNLDAGRNIRITPGIDSPGQLIMEANSGKNSYKFRNPNDYDSSNKRTAAIDCTEILTGTTSGVVYFKLPGNKTGDNTFAMLDDITSGTTVAGSAAKLQNPVTLNFTNDVTGSVTFDGSTSPVEAEITVTGGDVDFATNAGVSTNVKIIDGSSNADTAVYLTFVDDSGNGNRPLKVDSDLFYNQSTNKIVADLKGDVEGDVDGDLNGTATNATNVNIDNANISGNLSVIFGSGTSTGNQKLRRDVDFSYHRPSQVLFVPKITASGIITAQDFNSTSDRKLKTNVERISDPIEKVLKIDGVSFNWIESNKPSLGVIADNIEQVLPELVSNGDHKTVNYNGLIGLLIEVVKEQQNEINSVRERLSKLE